MGSPKAKYDYGCIMVKFKLPYWNTFINKILDKSDLTKYEQKNIENEPHCTILYGIHDDELDIKKLKSLLPRINTINCKVTNIKAFHNIDCDVLKFSIESEELSNINKKVRTEIPYTNSYSDYNAHMTIAYLRPGMSQKYVTTFSEPYTIKPITYKYSYANGDKEYFK